MNVDFVKTDVGAVFEVVFGQHFVGLDAVFEVTLDFQAPTALLVGLFLQERGEGGNFDLIP